jgi:hypothetical protein
MKSHMFNKLHMSSVSSNDGRHPVTKTFTTFHYTLPRYTSLHFLSFILHPTTPHYPLIWLNPI